MQKWELVLPDQWETDEGELVVCSILGQYFWSYTEYKFIRHDLGWDEKLIATGECNTFEEAKWKAIRAKERYQLMREVWEDYMEAQITEALEHS